jgi:predicted O-methyltransferase YrrM
MNIRSLRPAYFVRRVAQFAYERANPGVPWLVPAANRLLDEYLRSTDVGLEWGSGRSTAWFARRVGHMTSVEDNKAWHETVTAQLQRAGVADKVDYRYVACEYQEIDEPARHPYADVAASMADGSLDFALVDGKIRSTCMFAVMRKIRPGGLLILDNANRYIPNGRDGRHSTVHVPRDEPRTDAWARIIGALRDWRWINTTDGIWDTRFWIRPCP